MRYVPQVGDVVLDQSCGRVGRVVAVGETVWLCPPGGCCGWEAERAWVRKAIGAEALRDRVREANARSRGEKA